MNINLTKKKTVNRNNKDQILLHFMFINDAIAQIDQPITNLEVESFKEIQSLKKNQSSAENLKELEILRAQHFAYEKALKTIHQITNIAINKFDRVNVGGRIQDNFIKETTEKIANDHLIEKGKYPYAKCLHGLVCQKLFKDDPQKYIESIKKKVDCNDLNTYRKNPSWSFWRNVKGPVSHKTISNILTKLRLNNKIRKNTSSL